MATGPPRQATGPPRSGAGAEVGMLRGTGDPLLDFFGFRDLSRFHHLFVGKNLGEADRFGPTKIQNHSQIFNHLSKCLI